MPTILLALAITVPPLLVLFLRSDGPVAFFSLCAGTVLLQFVGDNAVLAADAMIPGGDPAIGTRLVLLLAPLVLSIVLLRKSIASSKLFYNLLPAIGTGLCTVLIVAPHLPFGAQQALADSPFWQGLVSSQDLVVGGTALVSLLSLWLIHRKHEKGHKKGHK